MYEKGLEVFLEIEKSLKDVGSRFIGSKLKIQGSLKEFSDIAEMLKQERRQFEVTILTCFWFLIELHIYTALPANILISADLQYLSNLHIYTPRKHIDFKF